MLFSALLLIQSYTACWLVHSLILVSQFVRVCHISVAFDPRDAMTLCLTVVSVISRC